MSDTGDTGNTTQEWNSFFSEAEKRASSLSSTEGSHVLPPRPEGADTGEVLRRQNETLHATIAEMQNRLRTFGPWVKELTAKLKQALVAKKEAEDLLEEAVKEADELRSGVGEAARNEDEVRRLRKEIQLLHRTVATHKAVALAAQEKADALARSSGEVAPTGGPPAASGPAETSVPLLASAEVLMTADVVDEDDPGHAGDALAPSDEVIELRVQLDSVLNQLDDANRRAEEAMRCEAGALQLIAELEKRFDTLNAEVISQRRFNAAKVAEAASAPVGQDEIAIRAAVAAQLREHAERLALSIEKGPVAEEPEPVPSAAPPLAEDVRPDRDDWLAESTKLETTGEVSGPVPSDWEETLQALAKLTADPVIKVDRTVTLEISEQELAEARAARNTLIMAPPVPLSKDSPSSEEIALDLGAALEEEATRPISESAEDAAELAAMAEEIRKERSQEIESLDTETSSMHGEDADAAPADETDSAPEAPAAEPEAPAAEPEKPAAKQAARKPAKKTRKPRRKKKKK